MTFSNSNAPLKVARKLNKVTNTMYLEIAISEGLQLRKLEHMFKIDTFIIERLRDRKSLWAL